MAPDLLPDPLWRAPLGDAAFPEPLDDWPLPAELLLYPVPPSLAEGLLPPFEPFPSPLPLLALPFSAPASRTVSAASVQLGLVRNSYEK